MDQNLAKKYWDRFESSNLSLAKNSTRSSIKYLAQVRLRRDFGIAGMEVTSNPKRVCTIGILSRYGRQKVATLEDHAEYDPDKIFQVNRALLICPSLQLHKISIPRNDIRPADLSFLRLILSESDRKIFFRN
jgi:hypothetical protein